MPTTVSDQNCSDLETVVAMAQDFCASISPVQPQREFTSAEKAVLDQLKMPANYKQALRLSNWDSPGLFGSMRHGFLQCHDGSRTQLQPQTSCTVRWETEEENLKFRPRGVRGRRTLKKKGGVGRPDVSGPPLPTLPLFIL
jgi:hypothetical protein